MDTLAAGFWGAFFGTVVLMLAGSVLAFARSLRRVALTSGLSGLISACFVGAFLGWLPIDSPETEARVLAHVAVVAAVSLSLMLLSLLGLTKTRAAARRPRSALLALALVVVAVGWALEPRQALALGSATAFAVGCAMLAVTVHSARRGDRLAWEAVCGIACMLVALAGLSRIALGGGDAPLWVHLVSASAGTAYLALLAAAMWSRYSYLIELSEVMAQGPSYDPVTRMRSHNETGQLLGEVFRHRPDEDRSIGLVAASIANLSALESLHGRAALNHALFVCAGRVRRSTPEFVDAGRLGEDGFILVERDVRDAERLVQVARDVCRRLSRPVDVGTSRDPHALDSERTEWVPQVGVSVLVATTDARPTDAVAVARAMSRTAWTYPSRLAWYDRSAGQIAELPLGDAA
ncbi:MAG TPA: GGDEF domain-containing protein [Ramlibacter sp.]|uniref:GGDEF domain-containing protein n=1 Tax=Ramlibacter sp. TaxID=1917967 RepID=UPI002BD26B8D|nr:GGDEF domain-containing protein [Ramlibacter sp.]HVZ43250.1 GGDEF domain-containing protein [Ramlibacter sp.]